MHFSFYFFIPVVFQKSLINLPPPTISRSYCNIISFISTIVLIPVFFLHSVISFSSLVFHHCFIHFMLVRIPVSFQISVILCLFLFLLWHFLLHFPSHPFPLFFQNFVIPTYSHFYSNILLSVYPLVRIPVFFHNSAIPLSSRSYSIIYFQTRSYFEFLPKFCHSFLISFLFHQTFIHLPFSSSSRLPNFCHFSLFMCLFQHSFLDSPLSFLILTFYHSVSLRSFSFFFFYNSAIPPSFRSPSNILSFIPILALIQAFIHNAVIPPSSRAFPTLYH